MHSLLEEEPAELGHDPLVLLVFFEGLQGLVQGLSGSLVAMAVVQYDWRCRNNFVYASDKSGMGHLWTNFYCLDCLHGVEHY